MGTRSLTKVIQIWKDEDKIEKNQTITCMYRQYDGHIDSHGIELAEWLCGYTIVNGMPMDKTLTTPMFNGMDCLAAQMFAHFKDGAGGIYCMHPDAEDCWEEYLYEISEGQYGSYEGILITVYETHYEVGAKEIFHGTPEELLTKIEEYVED